MQPSEPAGGSHCRLEPFTVEAWVEGDIYTVRLGRLRMWASHSFLCHLFNLPPSRVRLIVPTVGGSFGGKGNIVTDALALLAAIKTGRHVRLEYTREEEFIDTNPRPSMVVNVKDGIKKDGTLVARHVSIIVDIGAYGAAGGIISASSPSIGNSLPVFLSLCLLLLSCVENHCK